MRLTLKGILRSGDPFIWVTGSALGLSLIMVGGLLGLVLWNGLGFLWPRDLVRFELADGSAVLGQITDREPIPQVKGFLGGTTWRIQVKRANRDVDGADFLWIDEPSIVRRTGPAEAVLLERFEWGNFHGFIREVRDGDRKAAGGGEEGWAALLERISRARRIRGEIRRVEMGLIGSINAEEERIRLALRRLEKQGALEGPEGAVLRKRMEGLQTGYEEANRQTTGLREGLSSVVVMADAAGREKEIPVAQVVRAWRPNGMGLPGKCGYFAARLWEFLSEDPRESNTEGGIFPAIFGTVLLVIFMSILVMPMGIVAAVYLREYAKQGAFVSAVRIAVNNLAGVPSIVFGVFGVGFFIYFVGGTIDRTFFAESLPTPTFGTGGILWASLTLALLTVPVVIVATEEGLAAVPRSLREASLALGATRFETVWRVVLPSVMPSILTGLILSMARAAGEVAPLMITGVVKLAPSLPIDGTWPFIHLDRKFMHLGFHIYDVGFQSPNVDVARPMVYMTTLLLVVVIIVLNLTAILLRNRLRKRFAVSAF